MKISDCLIYEIEDHLYYNLSHCGSVMLCRIIFFIVVSLHKWVHSYTYNNLQHFFSILFLVKCQFHFLIRVIFFNGEWLYLIIIIIIPLVQHKLKVNIIFLSSISDIGLLFQNQAYLYISK